MASAEDGVRILKGKEEDVIWLPPAVLLYVFTISNSSTDFVIGILALVGARAFHDLVLEPDLMNEDSVTETAVDIVQSTDGTFKSVSGIYKGVGIGASAYAAIYYAPMRLADVFVHDNVILVALAALYWGAFAIATINFSESNPILATITVIVVPILVLFRPF